MQPFITLGLGIAAFTGTADAQMQNWTVGQTVQTTSGLVNGHSAADHPQVSEYLGIPFAQPPIGDLRFAPPQKYAGNSTINGTTYVCVAVLSQYCLIRS